MSHPGGGAVSGLGASQLEAMVLQQLELTRQRQLTSQELNSQMDRVFGSSQFGQFPNQNQMNMSVPPPSIAGQSDPAANLLSAINRFVHPESAFGGTNIQPQQTPAAAPLAGRARMAILNEQQPASSNFINSTPLLPDPSTAHLSLTPAAASAVNRLLGKPSTPPVFQSQTFSSQPLVASTAALVVSTASGSSNTWRAQPVVSAAGPIAVTSVVPVSPLTGDTDPQTQSNQSILSRDVTNPSATNTSAVTVSPRSARNTRTGDTTTHSPSRSRGTRSTSRRKTRSRSRDRVRRRSRSRSRDRRRRSRSRDRGVGGVSWRRGRSRSPIRRSRSRSPLRRRRRPTRSPTPPRPWGRSRREDRRRTRTRSRSVSRRRRIAPATTAPTTASVTTISTSKDSQPDVKPNKVQLDQAMGNKSKQKVVDQVTIGDDGTEHVTTEDLNTSSHQASQVILPAGLDEGMDEIHPSMRGYFARLMGKPLEPEPEKQAKKPGPDTIAEPEYVVVDDSPASPEPANNTTDNEISIKEELNDLPAQTRIQDNVTVIPMEMDSDDDVVAEDDAYEQAHVSPPSAGASPHVNTETDQSAIEELPVDADYERLLRIPTKPSRWSKLRPNQRFTAAMQMRVPLVSLAILEQPLQKSAHKKFLDQPVVVLDRLTDKEIEEWMEKEVQPAAESREVTSRTSSAASDRDKDRDRDRERDRDKDRDRESAQQSDEDQTLSQRDRDKLRRRRQRELKDKPEPIESHLKGLSTWQKPPPSIRIKKKTTDSNLAALQSDTTNRSDAHRSGYLEPAGLPDLPDLLPKKAAKPKIPRRNDKDDRMSQQSHHSNHMSGSFALSSPLDRRMDNRQNASRYGMTPEQQQNSYAARRHPLQRVVTPPLAHRGAPIPTLGGQVHNMNVPNHQQSTGHQYESIMHRQTPNFDNSYNPPNQSNAVPQWPSANGDQANNTYTPPAVPVQRQRQALLGGGNNQQLQYPPAQTQTQTRIPDNEPIMEDVGTLLDPLDYVERLSNDGDAETRLTEPQDDFGAAADYFMMSGAQDDNDDSYNAARSVSASAAGPSTSGSMSSDLVTAAGGFLSAATRALGNRPPIAASQTAVPHSNAPYTPSSAYVNNTPNTPNTMYTQAQQHQHTQPINYEPQPIMAQREPPAPKPQAPSQSQILASQALRQQQQQQQMAVSQPSMAQAHANQFAASNSNMAPSTSGNAALESEYDQFLNEAGISQPAQQAPAQPAPAPVAVAGNAGANMESSGAFELHGELAAASVVHRVNTVLQILLEDPFSILQRDAVRRDKAVQLTPLLQQMVTLVDLQPQAVSNDMLRPILSFVLECAAASGVNI